MRVHIKIGTASLCQCGTYYRLFGGVTAFSDLLRSGLTPVCQPETRADAERLVSILIHNGHDARVVEGECDQQGAGGPE